MDGDSFQPDKQSLDDLVLGAQTQHGDVFHGNFEAPHAQVTLTFGGVIGLSCVFAHVLPDEANEDSTDYLVVGSTYLVHRLASTHDVDQIVRLDQPIDLADGSSLNLAEYLSAGVLLVGTVISVDAKQVTVEQEVSRLTGPHFTP